MFNSARQEGSTAAALIHFYGAGFLIAWLFDDFFGVIDTSTYADNFVHNAPGTALPPTVAADTVPAKRADIGWSSETIAATLNGMVFWVVAALFTVGATVNCIYGMAGFNVGPRVVGPYSVLATGE